MDCNVIVSSEAYTLIICFERDVIDTALGCLAIASSNRNRSGAIAFVGKLGDEGFGESPNFSGGDEG